MRTPVWSGMALCGLLSLLLAPGWSGSSAEEAPAVQLAPAHAYWSGEQVLERAVLSMPGEEGRKLELAWSLAREGGGLLASSRVQATAPAGQPYQAAWGFPGPVVQERTDAVLELTVRETGKVLTTARVEREFWPRPPRLEEVRVALLDPARTSRTWLRALGVRARVLAAPAEVREGETLIIGRGALAQVPTEELLRAAFGRSVLVLAQPVETLERMGLRTAPGANGPAFPVAGLPEPLARLRARDLHDWRLTPPAGPEDSPADVLVETPTRGACTPLLESGPDRFHTPLWEAWLGGGRLVVCQLPLTEAVPTDPAATWLARGLLQYLAEPVPVLRKLVVSEPATAELVRMLGFREHSEVDSRGPGVAIVAQEQSLLRERPAPAVLEVVNPHMGPAPGPDLTRASSFDLDDCLRGWPGHLATGLGELSLHFGQEVEVVTFGARVSPLWWGGTEQRPWLCVGLDPRSLDPVAEPELATAYRRMCRVVAQLLTNLGAEGGEPLQAALRRLQDPEAEVSLYAE